MTSFLHVLLLYLLCVCGVEAVDTVTGCPNPGGPNQHTVLENLPTGTEVIIFKNITNITLSRTESYLKVRSKGLGEFAVTVQTPYDFETLQGSLNIIVGNQIETPPVFGGSNITYFNIPENSPQGTKVGTLHVTATEIEPSTFVLFTLTKNNTPFSVDWPPNGVVERYRTAVISIHKPDLLDYETTTQYTLTVTARIDGTNISSSATVIVNVMDVDDLPPKFQNPNGYVLTKPEAMYNQEEIIQMVAVDGDKSQKSTINYSLIRVFPETSLFHVNNGTGKVIVNGKLDRETCKNYLILVKAYQVDQPDLRIDVTTLNLTVSDVDDNPPVITSTMFKASIPENTPKGVTVLAVTATDADEGENAKFQYKIENHVNPGGFEIDNRTGILTVKNSTVLDRETCAKWTLKVFAVSIRNSSIKSNAVDVTITLLDENDNSPKFSHPNYTFTVNKTLSIPGQVGTVLATDKDESNNGVVRYHLEGKESHRFAIRDQNGSGLIEAVAALNSTFEPEYRFTVVASDMAASPYRRQSSVQVNVRVLDVNVNAPVFVNMTPNVSIKEDIDINSDVLWVQAYDEDPSDHLTFMLSNVLDFTLHKIDSRRSKIVINKALDRETTPNGYNITVKVTDSVHTSTATLSVNVEDINDNAPQFQSSTYNFTTPEEEPPRVIGHVKATDIDIQKNGMVHYTLVSPWNANFSVNKTGDIIVTSRLDRESLTSTSGKITLLVMAEDSGTPPLMTTATVIVQVEDVNDHAPLFIEKEENITIDEGSFLNTDLQAYDEDEGKNGHISYRIGSSNISLEITNGTLRSNASLTYGFYKAEIIAYNDVPYKPPAVANGTLTVNIHVEDINNHQPKFNQPNYNFSLLEDFAVGHVLSQRLSAVDKDETSAYNTVTYSIEDENSYFEVDPNNGTLRLIKPLDYEDKTQITFQVQATDGYEKHVTKVNVTVTVLDVNDNAPVFSKDIYKCSVAENSTGGLHCPSPIKAKDNDTVGNNGRLLYGIDDPLKSKFEINETTGVIHPRTPLDADTGPSVYIVTIIVKDNGSPHNSGSALVEVSVKDKNDNFPVILGPSHISIPENIPVNTSVGTIVATDLDINDTLTFSLNEARSPTTMATAAPLSAQIQGLDNDTFILGRSDGTNPASVEILVNKVLDRETNPNGYHLILRVTDSNHTSTASVSITIEDVNDNAPEFNPHFLNFTIDEGDTPKVIGNVTATDKDLDENAKLHYTVLPSWNSTFEIDQTGQIHTISALDRENLTSTSGQIALLVMAQDLGTPSLMSVATVCIKVKDVNDHAPHFNNTSMNITIVEGGNLSVPIEAYDEDEGENRNVKYIVQANATSLEIIHGTLKSTAPLTYGVYEAKIIAYNTVPYIPPDLQNGTLTVFIYVKDINDQSPIFNQTSYEFSLAEDFQLGHLVNNSHIYAQDLDKSQEYNTVTYSMAGRNDYFEIDPESAALRLIKPLDYEKEKRVNFQVIASDGDIAHQVSVNVSVKVLDVNDHAPVFSSAIYNCTVFENATTSITCNLDVNATDEDDGENGIISYSIQGPMKSVFKIENSTGVISPRSLLDYDTGVRTYIVKILATDNGSPRKNGSAVVEVSINDKNDNPPVIHGPSHFSIPENLSANTLIGNVFATDVDISSVLVFSLSNNTNFHIQNDTGALFTKRKFDYEKKIDRMMEVIVTVSDGLQSDELTISVAITNVNDEIPVFDRSSLNPTISQDMDSPSFYIQATDADIDSTLSYNISSNFPHINITRSSGLVTIGGSISSLDKDIAFNVSVSDGKHIVSATATVQVIFVNDNVPRFENSTYTFDVDEEEEDIIVGQVKAYDEDEGENRNVQYIVQTNATSLEIIHGTLISTAPLTYGVYEAKIIAFNTVPYIPPELENGTMTVFIYVKDINDQSPMFNQTSYEFSLAEDFQVGHLVNKSHIYAQDLDKSQEYNTVTYSMAGRNDYFEIDPESAALRLIKPLDYEKEKRVNFQVIASDGDIAHQVSVNVSVKVLDVNDHAPVFSSAIYNCTVFENATTSITCNLDVNATDEDDGENGIISYSIQGPMKSVFKIENSTGVISPRSLLDYDTGVRTYILKILATDNGSPRKNGSAVVEVSINDKNDNPPVIHGPSHFSIEENLSANTLIGNVFATDVDISSVLVFSLSNNTNFHIQNDTGALFTKRKFDYEKKIDRMMEVIVTVSDGLQSDELTISVAITNVNDEIPVFDRSSLNPTISQDMDSPSFYIQATDADIDSTLSYNISSNFPHINITRSSGLVTIGGSISSLDKDIAFNVSVSDGKHIVSATATVQVIFVNDNVPRFENSTYTFDVDEEEEDIIVGQVKAYDEDEGENRNVQYIVQTNATSLEIIHGTLISTAPLTYGVYEAKIIAFNTVPYIPPELENGTMTVFIYVKDINDQSPMFNQTSYEFSLAEDFQVGHLVNKSHIYAQDLDKSQEYNTVTYSMAGRNDYFEIDPESAALRLIKPLDYEKEKRVNFQVIASDGDIAHQVSVNVSVKVLDVNDHAPVFSSAIYNCTVFENATTSITCNLDVNATDEDDGKNGIISYSIQGPMKSVFKIENSTGVISPRSLLDYDTGVRTYILKILATDNGSPRKNGSAVVEVFLKDINDNPPVIHGPSHFSIEENLPANTSIGAVFATDVDISSVLVFSLDDNTNFLIQNNTGILLSTRKFDYENNSNRLIHVHVTVTDGEYNATWPISVAVTNVNDEVPVFINSSLNPTISEDMENPSFYIQATDGDMDSILFYNISSDSQISIINASGLVRIKGHVNSSATTTFEFDVSVSDGVHMETGTVTVHVTDVDNNLPRFENSTYTFNVVEEQNNIFVGNVKATDEDIDPINKQLFYMVPTLWSSNVTINSTSGDIYTVGVLDRESPSVRDDQVELIVMAVDTGSPQLTGTTLVIVSINDVNDHQPTFVQSSVSYTIAEGQCPSPLHNLTVVDKDEGKNKQTWFKIIEGTGIFNIKNNYSLECQGDLDVGMYNITIEAVNVEKYEGISTDNNIQTISVHVQDVNDHNPVFESTLYTLDLLENHTLGELYFTPGINATDADTSAEFNTVTYTIVQGNGSSYFAINHNTGRLWLKSPLDYEREKILSLTISASDGHLNINDNKQHNAIADVNIHIQNINDNTPIFTSGITMCSVLENVTGEFGCKVKASDADAGDILTYTLANTSRIFEVDSENGDILVKNSTLLDYDRGVRHFDIVVMALDKGSPQLTGSTIVSVEIQNANDEYPIFSNQTYMFEIPEEEQKQYFVGHVSATDLDDDIYGRLTFSLSESKLIQIDKTTGDIFTSVILDYENPEQRVLTDAVTASDGTNSVTATVTVSVLNVNDNTPLFNSSTYRKSIRENTATGQPLIQVRAFDEDSMSSLGYSIEGGNDKCGTFGINTTSGEISVLNKTCLDYERQKEYILVIEVTDGGSPARSSQAIVEVNVTDEDDVAPSFITETSFGVVKENEPAGTSILKIFVFDPDTSFENVTLSVNNSRFGFDNWTLQTNSQLNAEDIESYFLKISVSDGVIGHMRSQLLIVNVTDVNDNTPAFNSTSYNAVIPQNARDGSYVLTVWAKDNDISNLGFTFFLSEAEGDFVINSRTGVVTVANAHAHFCVNCNYTMNVHVVDYGEPPKSNSTQIDIRIDTSNHYAPVFKDTQYTVNVSEHKLYTDSIVNVSATDADCGGTDKCGPAGTVHYTILSGNHGQFIINKTTGFIYINGSLDFKDSPDYDLVVEARDQADDFKTDTTVVRVYVFDVNERPHFVKNVTSVCSVENVKAGDLVGIVTASDPDYSSPFHKLTYTLLNQNDTFHVNATTGKIYASRNVTASSIQTVVLQFVVTDRGGLNDSTTLRLSTGTKGKPVFDKNSTYIHVKIPENTPVPVYIADVNTTTENTGDISYQLTSQGPHTKGFRIGNSTVRIYSCGIQSEKI
ncbi:protocadherin Fat 4-like [Ylistrum balloti]|uniref:protocadherin Fat 4-like n=1 Tax=Ylistrum balloti TaxID=509963 RepID=UPI002905BBDC|nr:protocadherin Fat 4-like [Ylistrum balloti]